MKYLSIFRINSLFIAACMVLGVFTKGYTQCPQFYDAQSNPSSYPYWVSCNGDDFTLEILSDDAYGPYTIDWGDGNTSSGAGYTPGGVNPSHTYDSTVDTMLVTITINGTGCVINGVVVMEELVSAAIQIPNGGITKSCAPQEMLFKNASTNVSETTFFIWDFGDGSPQERYDESNWNQVISHTYEKGTVDCGTIVTLYAENRCSFGNPSINTYEPILIWDIDKAKIKASDELLCYPDTIVTFTNTTKRNCIKPHEGNFVQRYEYWRFIDYFGPGLDSIVDWRPWPPTQPITVKYPGIGTYTVELLDSNQCGIDDASITISIINPSVADFYFSQDTVCTDQEFTVTNNSSSGANWYKWEIVGDTTWVTTSTNGFTHKFDSEGEYEIKLITDIIEGTSSCIDTLSKFITVLPGPASSFHLDKYIGCDSLIANVTNTTVNGVTWFWDFGNGTTSNLRHPINPITYNQVGEYPISLTVTSANNCASVLIDTAKVFMTPQVDFSAGNACIGTEVQFTDNTVTSSGDPILNWAWNFGDFVTSSDQNPTHEYSFDGTYLVTLQVSTANCSADSAKKVTLHPVPTAIMYVPDTAGCNPFQVNFENYSTISTSYEWDFGDGTAVNTDVSPSHTFINNTPNNAIYTVRLIAKTPNGCADTTYQQIVVFPATSGSFTHNGEPGCGPVLVQFVNTSTGGVDYAWDFGDGSPISSAPNPAHLYRNQSAFIQIYDAGLIVTSSNGCTDTVSQPITVYPEPNFDFTRTPEEGCTPLEVDFGIQTNGNYIWDFDDGNTSTEQYPSHTFSHNNLFETVYNVTLYGTTSFGCKDTVTKTVTVKPNPVADFSLDKKSSCSPLEVQIINTSQRAINYQWEYGDGNTSNSGVNHSYNYINTTQSDVQHVIKLTAIADNGCAVSKLDSVLVFGNPVADFDLPEPACTPADYMLVNRSSNAATYEWDFDDGSAKSQGVQPNHTFVNEQSTSKFFNVQLVAFTGNSCPDTVSKQVEVYPLPNTDFEMQPNQGCHPLQVNMDNKSNGAVSYEWNYGDGTGSSNSNSVHNKMFENETPSPVNYVVELEATSAQGCTKSLEKTVEVFPKVTANMADVEPGCSNLHVVFNNESINASTYTWDFDDGSINSSEKHPSHVFVNNQPVDAFYQVQMIAISEYNCADTINKTVHVFAKPEAQFDLSDDDGCHVFDLGITNNSVGGSFYFWDYDDGTTESNPNGNITHSFSNNSDTPVERDVELIVVSDKNCGDTLVKTITVFPKVVASFKQPEPGCTPYRVELINTSIGANVYEWSYQGNKTYFENPSLELTNASNVNQMVEVELKATSIYGCESTSSLDVLVYPRPQAMFEPTPKEQEFPEATVHVNNLTPEGNWTYVWDYGDGVNNYDENPPAHTYSKWGDYEITLIVSGTFCKDTIVDNIIINPAIPQASFLSPTDGCVPVTVHFQNTSKYADRFEWDFGDGFTSTEENPVHTYHEVGEYTVRLTAHGSDLSNVAIEPSFVKVYAWAIADFINTPEYPQEVYKDREPVDFFNKSKHADRWLWNFGDGNTSTEEHPAHYYTEKGIFDVTLTANNANNCPNTYTLFNAVNVVAGGRLQMPSAFTPNPDGPNGGNIDGIVLSNDVFFPLFDRVEKFHMQIFNRWGEFIFESNDINIGWDGYFNGELCPQDVYVYKVEVVYPGGEVGSFVGDVTLLR